VLAIAAAAVSCVEKILQLDHWTSAPRAVSVSMRTAVWTVMWRQPAILAPFSGFDLPYFSRRAIRPGVSTSARSISLRPSCHRFSSFTLEGSFAALAKVAVAIRVSIGSVVRGPLSEVTRPLGSSQPSDFHCWGLLAETKDGHRISGLAVP